LLLSGCLKQELQTGLAEREAQEIIVILREQGIDAAKAAVVKDQEESWTVYVRGGDQNLFPAWRILQERGLPRPQSQGLSEVFSDSGLIPTASQEKARMIVGMSGELSQTLETLPGVVDARVHVVLPDNSPLVPEEQRNPATASVLIKYQGDSLPLEIGQVRQLIAHGVDGLVEENVAVVYKQIQATLVSREELGWSPGNQEFTVVSLALLLGSAVGGLFLLFSNRRQRTQIQGMRRQLAAGRQKELTE
jgi:type III secretion protein J